jgi:hypothetical protein
MRNHIGNNSNPKIEALLQKIAESRSALAEERVRDQKKAERESNRLNLIVGGVMVREGEDSPEFRDMLIRILRGSDIAESAKAFLVKRGWL